ncbi:MAG: ABC transporter ATP-binding protein [Azospirillaceae bacterium]|nr:ABC transporter ATP-binding protein [Azospirillaceae bacterium]
MTDVLLRVEALTVAAGAATLVGGISFTVGREKLAIVGESGSGKSLTARAIIGLLPPGVRRTGGRIALGDRILTTTGWQGVRGRRIGFVPQDPKYALNPAHRIGRQVEEALVLHSRLSAGERRERALDMLHRVGFPDPQRAYRAYPGEVSGGMGQRAMIAAMVIAGPDLLIADEPTSALDHALRDQILDLLGGLTDDTGMGLVLISHDLRQVARFADRVLVMQRGILVDRLDAGALAQAGHPYTRALWRAHPSAASYGTRLPEAIEETLQP